MEGGLPGIYFRQKHYETFRFNSPDDDVLSDKSCLLPNRIEARIPKELPQRNAGLLSRMTNSWIWPLMQLASKKGLTADDLYDTPPESGAEWNANRFEKIWHEEVKCKGEQKASVERSLLWLVVPNLVLSSACLTIYGLCTVMSSGYFMSELLHYVSRRQSDPMLAAMLVFGMTAMEALRSLFLSWTWSLNCDSGIRAMNAIMTSLYRKVLRLESLRERGPGEVINLFSVDSMHIFEVCSCGNFILGVIVSGPVAAALMTRVVGMWGAAGFAVLLCTVPIQIGLSKFEAKLRMKSLVFTDLRMRLAAEAITSIRLIKQCSWIDAFAKKISVARNQETVILEKASLTSGFLMAVPSIIPSVASLVTCTGVLLSTGSLTILQAFTFITTINSLRWMTNFLAHSGKTIVGSLHSTQRIKAILIMKERSATCSHAAEVSGFTEDYAISFSAASFSWSIPQSSTSIGHDDSKNGSTYQLKEVTLNIEKGKLYGVFGEVGSGKSSFLASMAGLIHRTAGKMVIHGSVAYAAQQAWIMNATLRDNILFGLPMNHSRYWEVVRCCGLSKDISILPLHDLTEVGDRGVTLSGGQKQRISLARAVYSDRDIYLLDDPLSAVDVPLGKHIYDKCIMGILKGKTVVLATQQLHALMGSDDILFVSNGQITKDANHEIVRCIQSHRGIHNTAFGEGARDEEKAGRNIKAAQRAENDLMDVNFDHWMLSRQLLAALSSETETNSDSDTLGGSAVPLLKQELYEKGRGSFEAFKEYILAAGLWPFTLSLILMGAAIFFLCASVWWLSFWLQREDAVETLLRAGNHLELLLDVDADTVALVIYGACISAATVFISLKLACFTKATMRASTNVHHAVLCKVLKGPIQFFDLVPTGQLINRFSNDINELDHMFPFCLESFIHNMLINFGSAMLMSIGQPYLILFVLPVFILVIIMYRKMAPGVREMKRLEHSARSKWLDHIATTVRGLATIRAYGKEQSFLSRFNELMEAFSMSLGLFNYSMRYLTCRFDLVNILMTFVAGCLIAFLPTEATSPAEAALAICSALSMAGLFQNMVRLLVESECRFLSIERLWSYVKELKSEPDTASLASVPHCWPDKGEVRFQNVSMSYRLDLPTVLKSVTFTAYSGEKIGIVGHSGSGKSSLGAALFRLAEINSGSLVIDGIDVRQVPLHLLRSKLSMIPQDPVLFCGSLRYNLDPLGAHSDEELVQSLEKCRLQIWGSRFSMGLDTHIVEGGENLSVGERQLICMARALLRRSKVLMMDEATASMDDVTSRQLMDTISDAFAGCTVLVIAHRLSTVLKCDRIMVLDNGKIAEMDTPEKLTENESSFFYKMLKQ